MSGRTVGIAATCALTVSALILPPGVAPTGESSDLSVTVVDPKSRSIIIPCSECAFPTHQVTESVDVDDALFWIQGRSNSLLLDFTVSDDGERLQLGGAPIYPPPQSYFQQGVQVKQVPSYGVQTDIANGEDRSADLEVTAYGLFESEKEALSPNDELVPLGVQIMGLENKRVGLEQVNVWLLRTGEGELLIMDVSTAPLPKDTPLPSPPSHDVEYARPPSFDHPHGPPHGPPHEFSEKDCSMLPAPLCRLRQMIDSKIDAAMGPPRRFRKHGGCPGRKGHPDSLPPFDHANPPHMGRPGHESPPQPHHGRPHHMRPHGSHHGHHHGRFWRHHFLRAFAKGLVAILIPVTAGITVGMTVSLLGLIFGRLIGYLWIKLVRAGQRGNASMALMEAAVEEDEGKPMLAEMEAPPVYEDAPAYQAIENEKE